MRKEKGGSRIKKLELLNRALLGKCVWRFALEAEDNAWKQCIQAKYGVSVGGWFTKDQRESHGVGLWKAINKKVVSVKHSCNFQLGNGGKKLRFWEYIWSNEEPFCVTFANLYSIASTKGALVSRGEVIGTQILRDPSMTGRLGRSGILLGL